MIIHNQSTLLDSHKNVVNAVHARITRNPCHRQKIWDKFGVRNHFVFSEKTYVFELTKGTSDTSTTLA